jgi:hypothetical protein
VEVVIHHSMAVILTGLEYTGKGLRYIIYYLLAYFIRDELFYLYRIVHHPVCTGKLNIIWTTKTSVVSLFLTITHDCAWSRNRNRNNTGSDVDWLSASGGFTHYQNR